MLQVLKNQFAKGAAGVVLTLTLIMLTACSTGNGSTTGAEEATPAVSSSASASSSQPQDGPLALTPAQLQALQALIGQPSTSPEMARQVQIILAVAGGMDNAEVARKFGKDADQVDLQELLKQLQ